MSKKIILLVMFAIIAIFATSFVNSTSLGCYNITNNKLICSYMPDNQEILNPKVINTDGLVYSLEYKPVNMIPNNFYNFTINYDLNKSKLGLHTILIIQNDKNIEIKVNKENYDLNWQPVNSIKLKEKTNITTQNDVDYNVNVSYSNISKQIIDIDLTLTNNTNKTKPIVLTAINVPNGITVDKKSQVIILDSKTTKIIPIQINYENNDSNKIEYTLSYSNKKILIPISLARDKMPILQTNRLTAFFSLAENNSKTIFIVLDVVLFIACIVLFTMFIGRLGNYIVKK